MTDLALHGLSIICVSAVSYHWSIHLIIDLADYFKF